MTILFDAHQKQIIDLKTGSHSCLAPAGSGKTQILTERIYQAINQGVAPADMLCLTFTTRAGMNMRAQVTKRIGEEVSDLFVGNVHSFCYQFYQRHQFRNEQRFMLSDDIKGRLLTHAKRELSELLELDSQTIIEVLTERLRYYHLDGMALKIEQGHVQSIIRLKNGVSAPNPYDRWKIEDIRNIILPLISPLAKHLDQTVKRTMRDRLRCVDSNIPAELLPYALACATFIHQSYEQQKQHFRLFDYDDLIINTILHIIEVNTDEEKTSLHKFNWVQIDEVQDLSMLHWLLIDQLTAENAHCVSFGDVNQSIYRFIGATIEFTMQRLIENVHYLDSNYRSPANLVNMTNRYCEKHFAEHFKSATPQCPPLPNALQYMFRTFENEHDFAILKLIQQHLENNDADSKVAILIDSNLRVENFSKFLETNKVNHFRISQHDLLSRELSMDFCAILNVLEDPNHRLAWARLLWRFGDFTKHRPSHLMQHEPQLAAIKFLAELADLGGHITDFIGISDCYQHRLTQLIKQCDQESVVFFDTETTGLDPIVDDVIQLAAVNHFSHVDLYCHSERDLSETTHIHKITSEILEEKGRSCAEQIQAFLDFCEQHTLVAHNLRFDDRMMVEAILKHCPDQLPRYLDLQRYCSLELARRFYPNLSSYRLGELLDHFNLEGDNNHNALNDVKAGKHLLNHLATHIKQRLPDIDGLVNNAENILNAFNTSFTPLWSRLQHAIQIDGKCSMDELLDIYLDHIKTNQPSFAKDNYTEPVSEIKSKLLSHAQHEFGHIKHKYKWLESINQFYQTAKESDLITPNNRVIVSTIHRAKGLEFDLVILPSVTHDKWPGYMVSKQLKSQKPMHHQEAQALLTEKKRLLYVGLTRAKQQLIVCSYGKDDRNRSYQLPYFFEEFVSEFKAI